MESKKFTFKVSREETGLKLQTFLQKKLELSGKMIKKIIDAGSCRVNGSIQSISSYNLKGGDQLSVELKQISSKKSLSMKILYEDPDLYLCNKPSGLVTQIDDFQPLFNQKIFLVHRLDKETSGIIVIAKNQKMQKMMEQLFRKREVVKTYVALVKGSVKKTEGVIENRLIKKKASLGQSIYGSTSSSEGDLAVTYWKCIKKGKNGSLLQCVPKTGRTHQIRVHLSEMGHPILGDIQYGPHVAFPLGVNRVLLHSYKITFIHPITKKKVSVTAPIPKDFAKFVD